LNLPLCTPIIRDFQPAATDNHETAQKLNNDSQDKKLAKESRRDAKIAQKAAKAGREATYDLKTLQEEISKLKKQITEDEVRLGITPNTTL
jgi:hypothetical protein